jgi:hypothetical protein
MDHLFLIRNCISNTVKTLNEKELLELKEHLSLFDFLQALNPDHPTPTFITVLREVLEEPNLTN